MVQWLVTYISLEVECWMPTYHISKSEEDAKRWVQIHTCQYMKDFKIHVVLSQSEYINLVKNQIQNWTSFFDDDTDWTDIQGANVGTPSNLGREDP